jgi:hypothetical protein
LDGGSARSKAVTYLVKEKSLGDVTEDEKLIVTYNLSCRNRLEGVYCIKLA